MDEENMIPLSYVSQYNYCKRRVALLMNEQQWKDSVDTMKGNNEHCIVHSLSAYRKGKNVVINDLYVFSNLLHLSGRCDSVEAYSSENGCIIPFLDEDKYELYPIDISMESSGTKLNMNFNFALRQCA